MITDLLTWCAERRALAESARYYDDWTDSIMVLAFMNARSNTPAIAPAWSWPLLSVPCARRWNRRVNHDYCTNARSIARWTVRNRVYG